MNITIKIILGVLAIIFIIIFVVYLQPEELDDVHPWIMNTNDPLIRKSTWLWVIPLYMDEPISNHPEWVLRLKKSGKKIGMHGVRHTKNEFSIDRTDEYINKGVNEFIKAFGYYPTHFKAPSLLITNTNAKKIRERGIKIRNWLYQRTRRVYHSPKGRMSNGWLVGEFSYGLTPMEQIKYQRKLYTIEHS